MQLHHLPSTNSKSVRKRIGRGGKRGSYSGRGVKGQKSRAGRRIRPAARDLLLRIPKMRGFANKLKKDKPIVLNLETLEKAHARLKGKSPIDLRALQEAFLVPRSYRGKVKILAQGEIKTSLTLSGLQISKSARMKIERAGGTVTP